MTTEDLKNRITKIELESQEKKKKVMIEFCDFNNPYKKGDIIKDYIGALKIQSIKYTGMYGLNPCCVYYGIELKKDLTPMKRQKQRGIYQENIT